MSFERPITIKDAVEQIHRKKYLIPAIQRELVWDTEQIECLFDSLMRDYPIGSFLFWQVPREKNGEYQFYEFIRDYHERDTARNAKAHVAATEEITAILDGQQRLTALYLSLKGSMSYKVPRLRWENDEAFPKRHLYLNLLKGSEDSELEFDFRFLTSDEAEDTDQEYFWFKVGDILNLKEHDEVNEYLISNDLTRLDKEVAKFASKTLYKLHRIIHTTETINFYLEKGTELDKVLNIFIRVNSGGEPLSYSDLLLSVATAQWHERDAREVIHGLVDELNRIGRGFDFDKDFVLKACLVLSDFSAIAFKVDNFNKGNMLKIEKSWDEFSHALRLATRLVSGLGFNYETLKANSAVIPIAYYLLKKGLPDNFAESTHHQEDRRIIHKWLNMVILKKSFGGKPDNVLKPIRDVLNSSNQKFPLEEIIAAFKGTPKSITFGSDDIESLLGYHYGQPYMFPMLALLYPTLDFRNKFHMDHIFPDSKFKKKNLKALGIPEERHDAYIAKADSIANLQLLEGTPNQEKSAQLPSDWIARNFRDKESRADYMKRNFIPDMDLGFEHFEKFVDARERLLLGQFQRLLGK